jgi:3-oxoadipate enol-lactonase
VPEQLRVISAGVEIAVRTEGAGPPVLLLHGIGSASDAFDRQLPALASDFRCLAWDAPGYGASADPPGPPGMDGYAAGAADVLRQAGAVPAHVVGVSWGGVIATHLALVHPDRVRSLTLADSSRGSAASPERADAMRSRGAELDREGVQNFAASRAPRLLSPTASGGLVGAVAAAMARAIRNPGYGWAAEAMAETDHLDALTGLQVPTLVVVGEHDTITTVEASQELAHAVRGARYEVIEHAGHLANQERPDAFNDVLLDFLRGVERSRADRQTAHAAGGASQP